MLVVDDLQVNRRLLARVFERSMGVRWVVEQAATAEEGLASVLAAVHGGGGGGYDLVIMDEVTGPASAMRGSEARR